MSRDIPASLMFQDRIPYHAHQSDLTGNDGFSAFSFKSQNTVILENLKSDQNASFGEVDIYAMLKKSQVINTKDFMMWNMDVVWKVLNGPLWHLPSLMTTMKSKFVKVLSFLFFSVGV